MNRVFFLCGIPGSGKSTWAEANKEKFDFNIHSSDNIRAELGNVNDQSQNELVFTTLHKRIKDDLLAGKNVCYDATGLKRKNRMHFLQYIKDIPCEKVCVLFATPVDICKQNNTNRERKVPERVIDRMLMSFECPCKQEGFDEIQIVWWDVEKDGIIFDLNKDMEKWCEISHNNPHHSLSVGNHMIKAWQYACDMTNDFLLQTAAYIHDCGKPMTKKFIDSKGNPCEIAHFYNHNNCGAYNSLFYLKDMFKDDYMQFTDNEILFISLLTELHMYPFLRWNKSEKTKEKDLKLFGEGIVNCVLRIHEADLAAH